ncbi:MAG TPA: hypothetical protein VKX24_00210, partial [Acidimicrobiia bacterium]|nr:hypothetical protein [Acidimicrobiia bacterium]
WLAPTAVPAGSSPPGTPANRVINVTASPISAGPGTAFSGTVATFTIADPTAVASQFSATVDWGDATTPSPATVTGPTGGPFTVTGTHTYAGAGTFSTSVTIDDLTLPAPSGSYQLVATTIDGPNQSGTGSNPLGFATATASCPPATVLVSGGGVVEPASADVSVHLEGSFPSDASGHPITTSGATPQSWTALSEDGLGDAGNVTTAWALCGSGGPSSSTVALTTVQGPNGAGSTSPPPTGTGFTTVTVSCPTGKTLTGGGVETIPGNLGVAGGQPSPLHVNGSYPSDASANQVASGTAPTSWTGSVEEGNDVNGTTTQTFTTAFAICSTTAMTTYVQSAPTPGPFGAAGAALNQVTTTVSCPAGTDLLGGGGYTDPPSNSGQPSPLHLVGAFPSDSSGNLAANGGNNPAFWTASAREGNDVGNPPGTGTETTAFALCSEAANNASDSGTATVSSPASADVSVTLSAAPAAPAPGAEVTYTAVVTNNGPSSAAGVSVSDTLPAGESFVSASSPCLQSSGTVTCGAGTMADGASTSDTIVVRVTGSGTIADTASVTSSTADPNSANNTASASITVTSPSPTTVSGKVTDALGGNPIVGVCAYLYTSGGTRTADPGVCTSAAGTYTMTVAAPGSYTIAFFDPSATHDTQWYNGATTEGAATAFTLSAGQALTGINAAMAPIEAVAGTVTDQQSGAPLAGVCVYPYTNAGARTSDPGVCTNAQGTYLLPIANPGSYAIGFYDPDGSHFTVWYNAQPAEGSANPVTLSAGQEVTGIGAAMPPVESISGTITDAASHGALSGVCVYLYTAAGARTSDPGVCSLANGSYDLPVHSPGSYTLAFLDPTGTHTTQWYNGQATEGAATTITLTAGETVTGDNAAMSP